MPESVSIPKVIKYHFVKSSHFRVIYSEGVAGGVSPRGMIQMTFFNERAAIPQMVVHEVMTNVAGARPGPELTAQRVSKDGIVREMETEVIMSLAAAESLYNWLGTHIAQLKKFQNSAKSNVSSQ